MSAPVHVRVELRMWWRKPRSSCDATRDAKPRGRCGDMNATATAAAEYEQGVRATATPGCARPNGREKDGRWHASKPSIGPRAHSRSCVIHGRA